MRALLRGEADQATSARFFMQRARSDRAIKGMRARYGDLFPGFDARPEAWVSFADWLWRAQEWPMQDRLYLSEKIRLFRDGQQWCSSNDGRSWSVPTAPRGVIRAVLNMVGPAQDYRLNVIQEQRPGYRVNPHGNTSEDRDAALAQQIFCDWLHWRRGMPQKLQITMRYAQDFGAAGMQAIWNSSLGIRREAYVPQVGADGEEQMVALDEDGNVLPQGAPAAVYYDGDVDFVPIRGDQMRVDPEALDVHDARWLQIRRLRQLSELVFEHGEKALAVETGPYSMLVSPSRGSYMPVQRYGPNAGIVAYDEERFGEVQVAEETNTYLAPSDVLPDGLFIVCAGNRLMHIGPLPFGPKVGIPVARFTDGGTGADFFPVPAAANWLENQININALLSRILQSARMNSGGRLLAYQGSIVKDTYTNTIGSLVEWKGPQAPQWLQAAQIGEDTWRGLQFAIQQFENTSGWNDVARGQTSSSTPESGRGILAIREQYERNLAPFIRAASEGMASMARLAIGIAAWGYLRPRLLPILGEDRPDLARFIKSADLERQTDIYVEPETMMPMPRALKQQMLREELELQAIDLREYRKRSAYSNIRDMQSPDDQHWSRAKRVNWLLEEQAEAITAGQLLQPPLMWQDDPTIHQSVLQDLILDDRKPPAVIRLAAQRWDWYAMLAAAHQGDPNASMQVKALIDQMMPGGPLPGPPVPGQQPIGPAAPAPAAGAEPGAAAPAPPDGKNAYAAAAETALGQADNPAATFDAANPS